MKQGTRPTSDDGTSVIAGPMTTGGSWPCHISRPFSTSSTPSRIPSRSNQSHASHPRKTEERVKDMMRHISTDHNLVSLLPAITDRLLSLRTSLVTPFPVIKDEAHADPITRLRRAEEGQRTGCVGRKFQR